MDKPLGSVIVEGVTSDSTPGAEPLVLYGSFEEAGYLVKAFMPGSFSQPCQWTIEFYELDDAGSALENPCLTETLPMFASRGSGRTSRTCNAWKTKPRNCSKPWTKEGYEAPVCPCQS